MTLNLTLMALIGVAAVRAGRGGPVRGRRPAARQLEPARA
jgi:hypothetical protein